MKRASGEGVLVSWALPHLTDREKVVQIMDPALEGQYSMKEVIQVAAIAAMCVQPETKEKIEHNLENIKVALPPLFPT
ncbi:unnamed protein product, partial [Vitis vinifera]